MQTAVSVPDQLVRAAEQHARRMLKRTPRSGPRLLGPCSSAASGSRVVALAQGEVWWADLPAPTGSGSGFRRPVVVIQGDSLNRSRLATAVCVPLTGNLRWADAPGNVRVPARASERAQDSVTNAS